MTPRALAILMIALTCVMHGVDGVHDPGETVASATIDSPAPELPRRMDDCVTNLKQELGVAGSTTEAETLTLALEELRKTKAENAQHVKMRKQQDQIKDDVFLGQGVGVPKSAICSSSGGTLPCDTLGGLTSSGCKDSDVSKTFKYWVRSGTDARNGRAICQSLIDTPAFEQTTVSTTFIPGTEFVLSKPFVAHPHKASSTVGVFGFKRIVCNAKNSNKKKCEEFKTSFCIQCPSWTGFKFRGVFQAQSSEKKRKFMTTCAKHAFSNGKVKSSFACNAANRQLSQFTIAAI